MYRQAKGPSGLADFPGGPSFACGPLMSFARPGAALADPDLDTFFTPSRASRTGHDGPMEPVRGKTSSRRNGIRGGLAGKRAADSRALALLPTIRKLMAAGFVSQLALANELNRRRTPTTLGGKWHRTSVARVIARLGLTTNGRINNGLPHKQAADVRAKALASTIRKLRRAGFVSANAIARELNEREIPTAWDRKWHRTTAKRLLRRLERGEG